MCRSDPILQRVHGASQKADMQRVPSSPPGDGHTVKPGSGLVRDGSIKNLVSCYENKVEEVY